MSSLLGLFVCLCIFVSQAASVSSIICFFLISCKLLLVFKPGKVGRSLLIIKFHILVKVVAAAAAGGGGCSCSSLFTTVCRLRLLVGSSVTLYYNQ